MEFGPYFEDIDKGQMDWITSPCLTLEPWLEFAVHLWMSAPGLMGQVVPETYFQFPLANGKFGSFTSKILEHRMCAKSYVTGGKALPGECRMTSSEDLMSEARRCTQNTATRMSNKGDKWDVVSERRRSRDSAQVIQAVQSSQRCSETSPESESERPGFPRLWSLGTCLKIPEQGSVIDRAKS